MILAHCFSGHHHKYMDPLARLFKASRSWMGESGDGEFCVTNSLARRPDGELYKPIRELLSAHKVVIFIGHSMFDKSQIENLRAAGVTTLLPGEYSGHYMTLFHYETPPSVEQRDETLICAPSHFKSLDEFTPVLRNLRGHIRIRLHPGTDSCRGSMDERDRGLTRADYETLDVELVPELEGLTASIDRASRVYSFTPSSTVAEAAIRSAIWGMDKRFCLSDGLYGQHTKLGIFGCTSPTVDHFLPPVITFTDRFVIGHENQQNEILKKVRSLTSGKF